jgi:hypothetical protein
MSFRSMFFKGLFIAAATGAVLVLCLKLIYNIDEKSSEKGGVQLLETELELLEQQEEIYYENT